MRRSRIYSYQAVTWLEAVVYSRAYATSGVQLQHLPWMQRGDSFSMVEAVILDLIQNMQKYSLSCSKKFVLNYLLVFRFIKYMRIIILAIIWNIYGINSILKMLLLSWALLYKVIFARCPFNCFGDHQKYSSKALRVRMYCRQVKPWCLMEKLLFLVNVLPPEQWEWHLKKTQLFALSASE